MKEKPTTWWKATKTCHKPNVKDNSALEHEHQHQENINNKMSLFYTLLKMHIDNLHAKWW